MPQKWRILQRLDSIPSVSEIGWKLYNAVKVTKYKYVIGPMNEGEVREYMHTSAPIELLNILWDVMESEGLGE